MSGRMLLDGAIGDAYGAAYEFAPVPDKINLLAYAKHPKHQLVPGHYTDDTQMSMAIAELLVDTNKQWTKRTCAASFLSCFKRDPIVGYARGFQIFLAKTRSVEEFLDNIRPDSEKNGAAMRAWPIGIVADLKRAKEMSTIQAKVTHDSPVGIASAQASTCLSHYFIYNLGPKDEVGEWLEQQVPEYKWNTPWEGKVSTTGNEAVQAAVTAIKTCDTMRDILEKCVRFTGDTDTVASIALGSASNCAAVNNNLHLNLELMLKNGKYGRDYIKELDTKLAAMKGSSR